MISSVDWKELWDLSENIDGFVELFTLTILQVCEICYPKKVVCRKKTNHSLNILNRKRRKLQSRLKSAEEIPRSPTTQIASLQNKLALIHVDIRDAINSDLLYREQQAVGKIKENQKYFYSYAKQFSKKKESISMLFDDKGQIKTSPKELADILQTQFISVFSDLSKANWSEATFNPSPIQVPFADELMEFTIDDIIAAIDKIYQNAASGPDEMPAKLLKNCKNSIAIPIHLIWSHSLANGYVPTSYKLYHIVPLHKKDSKSIPANYRPVSLTSHVFKVFERVLRKKMVEHLETNDLLCNNQHGFRSGRSCLTQLLHHFDDVLEALMNNQDCDSIYRDYAKAFDKVDHKILLK